jgi:GxxExxY protein
LNHRDTETQRVHREGRIPRVVDNDRRIVATGRDTEWVWNRGYIYDMDEGTWRADNTSRDDDPLTRRIIGCAIAVHRAIGPGLLESAYEECLVYELVQSGLMIARQVPLPVVYREVRLECGYRLDIVVEHRVVLELKTVEKLLPIHDAQLLTYLRLSSIRTGLLINFHSTVLKNGIKRLSL